MKKCTESLEELSFRKYSQLTLDDSGVVLPLEQKKNYKNVIYALVVDGVVEYVGKTNNLRKRINYYRTSISRSGYHSDMNKSSYLVDSLRDNRPVDIWFRQCFVVPMKQDLGVLSISTMDIEEPHIINLLKPRLNKHYIGDKNG